MVPVFRMISTDTSVRRDDGRLWALAFGASLVLNLLLLVGAGWWMIASKSWQRVPPMVQAVPEETVMIIPAEMLVPDEAPQEPAAARFARTSADQQSEAPERASFIGERDTLATSDRAPDADAPPLPSQAGEPPRDEMDLETTESDYQDGALDAPDAAVAETVAEPVPMAPEVPPVPEAAAARGEEVESPGKAEEMVQTPPRERLLDGPMPYDVPVSPEPPDAADDPKPRPPERPQLGNSDEMPPQDQVEDAPKPTPAAPEDPAFRGFQRKTAIRGSISRSGRSALDVADTPEGRYQAMVSRAVELEWQRNCARHRDFITPGYLTVRFFVDPGGKVRSVQFVGEMETGEVQKGFTLNSIRDARIPAMPPEVRKQLDGEPLELIFNFYF